ncbi:MAG: NAD/NADP octopine/nopaline dehydrogenase family protein [Anaerolineales bacterium]|jgi:opine dehydrogenase
MNERPVIAVLGAGNGGFCATADLALRGYEVRLYESPSFVHTIEPVVQAGGIALRGILGEGFARPALVSTNIQSTLDGAEIILVIVPANGHKTLAKTCAPYLEEGQVVVLVPGCFGGALEFHRQLHAHGVSEAVIIAETTSLMYAAKKENGYSIWARGLKDYLPFAALPARHTQTALSRLRSLFPQLTPYANVLETSFHNLNHVVHPVAMLLNIGFIESKRIPEWFLYPDGYTPSTGRVGDLLDAERLAIARSYGIEGITVVETLRRYYGHQGIAGENLYELFSDSPVHSPALGPRTTHNRLLSEDIPYGLVPMASFARLAGVPTPLMDSLITLASTINQIDYRQCGRGMEDLGLSGKTPEEIVQYVSKPQLVFN